jgi:hypothetical protein
LQLVRNKREHGASGDGRLSKEQRRRASPSIAVAALRLAFRICTETLAKSVQERYGRVPRAPAIRPADEALVRRHRAGARRLQARQGGRRAPPRRRAGTAHELPRLRRPRSALHLLRASFRVGTPRPRVVPGMSDDGRAIAPPLTAPHTYAGLSLDHGRALAPSDRSKRRAGTAPPPSRRSGGGRLLAA